MNKELLVTLNQIPTTCRWCGSQAKPVPNTDPTRSQTSPLRCPDCEGLGGYCSTWGCFAILLLVSSAERRSVDTDTYTKSYLDAARTSEIVRDFNTSSTEPNIALYGNYLVGNDLAKLWEVFQAVRESVLAVYHSRHEAVASRYTGQLLIEDRMEVSAFFENSAGADSWEGFLRAKSEIDASYIIPSKRELAEHTQRMRRRPKKSVISGYHKFVIALISLLATGGIVTIYAVRWVFRFFDLAPHTLNPRAHEELFYLVFIILPILLYLVSFVVLAIQALRRRIMKTWSVLSDEMKNSWRLIRDVSLLLFVGLGVLFAIAVAWHNI